MAISETCKFIQEQSISARKNNLELQNKSKEQIKFEIELLKAIRDTICTKEDYIKISGLDNPNCYDYNIDEEELSMEIVRN